MTIDLQCELDRVINTVVGQVNLSGFSGISAVNLALYCTNGDRRTLTSTNIPTYLIEEDAFSFTFPNPRYLDNLSVEVSITHAFGTESLEEGVTVPEVHEELVIGQFEDSDADDTDNDIDNLPPYTYDDEDPLHRGGHDGRFYYDQGPPVHVTSVVEELTPIALLDFSLDDPVVIGSIEYMGGGNRVLHPSDFIEQESNVIPLDVPRYAEDTTTNLYDSSLVVSMSGGIPDNWRISTSCQFFGELIEETDFANLYELSIYNADMESPTTVEMGDVAVNITNPLAFSCQINSISIESLVSGSITLAINFYNASDVLIGYEEIEHDMISGWAQYAIVIPSTSYPPTTTKVRPRATIRSENDIIIKFFVPTLHYGEAPLTPIAGATTRDIDIWTMEMPDSGESLSIEAEFETEYWNSSFTLLSIVSSTSKVAFTCNSGVFNLFIYDGSITLNATAEAISDFTWFPAVLSKDESEPPSNPVNGDSYLLFDTPTGGWAGHGNEIATWNSTLDDWEFASPNKAQSVYIEADGAAYSFDGSKWIPSIVDEENTYRCLAYYSYADDIVRISVNGIELIVTKPLAVPLVDLENGTIYFGTNEGSDAINGELHYFEVKR